MKAIEAKIVVLGAQGVGKTSLVSKYISNAFTKETGPTIGASFFTCKINLNDFKIKMQVWDTAGQERFKAMAPMYYRNANAAMLVFDVTQHNSFVEVKTWIQELQRNVAESMFLLLVGNKIDLEELRAVSSEEAFLYAQSIGAKYVETSVVQDQGIDQVFVAVGLGIINLCSDSRSSTLRRYESNESMLSHSSNNNLNYAHEGVHIAIDSPDVTANAEGRLELIGHSIDHIAHADIQKSGWCCY